MRMALGSVELASGLLAKNGNRNLIGNRLIGRNSYFSGKHLLISVLKTLVAPHRFSHSVFSGWAPLSRGSDGRSG
jgi:hypothetical protein